MKSENQWVRHSEDVHHQATLLQAWDQDYFQLHAGAFTGSLSTFRLGATRLFSERMNRATFQHGALPPGRLAFGLPLRARGRSCICGEEGGPNTLLVFSGRGGFEFLSPDGFEFLGIEVDTTGFDDPVFQAMICELDRVISSGRRSIPIEPARAAKLGRLLHGILHEQGLDERLEELPGCTAAFSRGLVGWLLDMLQPAGGAETEGGRNTLRHWDTITAIHDLVADGHTCPVSVAELTLELGVSRRTLQNACQEVTGLSPVQYLRALRLSEARRMLQSDRPVTEAATQFGFWHLGYFSRDYRQMFGELPSVTRAGAGAGPGGNRRR
ncbi:helix-turn-helix domain-containing protein [Pseudogemmobacter bohemicus]|uniref:helix-turn-helix domain-containing protein n=1 Tax=Pseudogemmobacter bohemicus TaxID=2250708 RepID=UPI0022B838D3|nr:helix-turn-helix domain-containing protein [Pseudogemmobacter bohemicus]